MELQHRIVGKSFGAAGSQIGVVVVGWRREEKLTIREAKP